MKKFFVFIFLLSFALGFSQTNPIATDVKTAHFKDVNGLIHLVGSDAEFGVLTYTIVSLPTHGTLKDPLNSDAIISVGASLTGNLVTFVPHSDENHKYIFSGITSFTYKVTDDTSRESDTKTVSVKVFDSYLNPPTLIGSEIDGKSAGDNFGRSIALSEDGTIMAVGSPYNDGNGEKAGLVRVYKYNGTSWAQLGIDTQLQGAAAGDYFGSSVSLSGDGTIIAVGLPYHTGESSNSGEVKIFKFESDSWSQLGATVIPPYTPSGSSKAVSEQFGNDVRLSSDGKTLAVSDIWFDRSGGTNSGRVVVYRYDGTSWSSIGDEFALYGSNNDNLSWGLSLSSNGNILAVGGHENDDAASNAGQVKIFEYDSANTEWDLKSTLLGDSSNDKFGAAIDLNSSGLIVAVGSPYDKPDSFTAQGSVSVYGWNGTSYVILGSEIKGEHKFDYFGSHLSLDNEGSSLAIMAPGHDNQENSPYLKKGHVKVYNYEVSSWVQSADIDGAEDANQSTGSNAESKGQRVFLSGDGSVLAIGADENDGSTGTDSGHVRVYKLFENQIIPQSTSQTVAFELFEQQTSSEEIILTGSDGDSGPSDLIYIITELNTAKLYEGSTEITSADIPHTLTANKVKYNSNSDVVVNDSFKFIVHDGKASSVPDTVTLTVTPDNDAPIATDQSVSTNEDVALDAITLASTDVDSPQGDMIYIIETLPTKGALKEGGTAITLSGTVLTAKDIIYTPSSNYSGADSFKFKVKDKGVGSDGVTDVETSAIAATISITVNNTDNDAPVAEIQSIILSSDATETGAITLVAKDFDDDDSTLTYTIASLPSNGKLKVDGTEISATGDLSGVLTYSPNVDFNGDDTFTFTAKDDEGAVSDPATVTISVTNVNDSPVSQDQSITTREDTVTDPAITLVATDVDDDDSTLVYTILTLPSKGTLKDGATEISAAGTVLSGATLTYTPNTNYNGNDSFTFSAKDDESAVSEIATVSITVSSWNDPPVADPQNLNTFEDVPLSLTLTGTDVDEDELTYILYSLPSNGTLKQGETTIVAGDLPKTLSSKDFSYVPNSKYKGTDSFKFKVRDLTPDFFASTNNLIFVKNGANKVTYETELGKTYFLIEPTATKMDWPVAKNLTDSFYGARMYIPINAEVEKSVYDALNSMSRLDGPFWMGLYQDRKASDYSEPSGGWIWVDGVKLEDRYTNWYSNEPNNAGNEDYGQFNFGSFKIKWNDMSVGNGQSYALFQFTAEDSTAEINITISEFNNPPVADSQNLKTDEDTALKIKLTASDVENDPLTYVVKTLPNYGQLKDGNKVILESELPRVLPADSLSYIPNLDYIGDDSFDFLVKANSLASFAKANGLKFISQDGVPVTYQKPAGKTYFLIQNETGQSGFNPVDWPVAKTLTESIEGAGMYVILNAEMSALVMNGLNNMGVGKGTSNLYWLGLYQDKTSSDYAEPGGEDQNWGGWTWTDGVTLKDRGYFNWRPGEPNNAGPEDYGQINWAQGGEPWNDMRLGAGKSWPLFEFSINDSTDSNTATISIEVQDLLPLADSQTVTFIEGSINNAITLTGSDPKSNAITYILSTIPEKGTLKVGGLALGDLPLTVAPSDLTYDPPNENYFGEQSFKFKVNNGENDSAAATVTIIIDPVNDLPESDPGNYSTKEDVPIDIIHVGRDKDLIDVFTTHTQMGTTLPQPSEQLGESLALSANGKRLILGAYSTGAFARVYDWNGTDWEQLGETLNGETNGDWFGEYVSISNDGNRIAVAGSLNDNANGTDAGHIKVFDWNGTSWDIVGSPILGNNAGDTLGYRGVHLSGDGRTLATISFSGGYVVTYAWDGSAWNKIGALIDIVKSPGNPGSPGQVYLSTDGKRLAVGSVADGSKGNVRVFDWDGSSWIQFASIDGKSGNFGCAIDLSRDGKKLIVGEKNTSLTSVYDISGASPVQIGADINYSGNQSSVFWRYVSISDDGNRVGIPVMSSKLGVFDWDGTLWNQLGKDVTGGFGESFDMSSDAKIMAAGIHSGPNKVFNILNLEYIITTLPSNGTLKEGAKTLVAADLPYTLTTSDQKLTYTPNNNYYGTDSYLFKLNDGKADSTNSLNGNREDSKVTITIEEFILDLPLSNYKTTTTDSCKGSDVGILNIEVTATTFRKTGTTVDIPITYNVAIEGIGNVGTIVSPNKILQVKDLAKGTYKLIFTVVGEPKYIQELSFTIGEVDVPAVYDVGKIELCDDAVDGDDLNGLVKFDTSTIINGILKNPITGIVQDANLLNIEFTYFDQATNASVSAATLPNPFYSGSQTVAVKLTSKVNTSCDGIGSINFVVNTLPIFERIETNISVCTNLEPITIGVASKDSRTYSYVWTRNGTAFTPNIGGIDSSIIIGLGGEYIVTATTEDGTSCSSSMTIKIKESSIAKIEKKDIVIKDLNPGPNNTITILTETLGIGDYEFAIDDKSGPYQDEPVFENIRPGLHTIYVRDKNECGIAQIDFYVIGYKKFFTPNGDGIHDTWNIIGLTKTNLPKTKIYIFDRFGKLLKELDPLSPGWDGTFIGKPMPSTDYWFRVQLEDGREFKSHFSLVRDWD